MIDCDSVWFNQMQRPNTLIWPSSIIYCYENVINMVLKTSATNHRTQKKSYSRPKPVLMDGKICRIYTKHATIPINCRVYIEYLKCRVNVIGEMQHFSPTSMPVSIFLGSCTILPLVLSRVPCPCAVVCFLRRSGARWASRFTDLTLSVLSRCIVRLPRGTDPYSGVSGSRGAGGQLPPMRLNRSTWEVINNKKLL